MPDEEKAAKGIDQILDQRMGEEPPPQVGGWVADGEDQDGD